MDGLKRDYCRFFGCRIAWSNIDIGNDGDNCFIKLWAAGKNNNC
jgi:hypothetical protein